MFPARLRRPRAAQSIASKRGAFSPRPGRARPRASAVGLLIALATTGLALAPQAASAATLAYSASISPTVATAGASATFTVTLTNQSSTAEIKKVVVHIPTGFTLSSVGAPSPGTWTVVTATNGSEVTLTGLLKPGASVNVPITATAPTTPGTYKWATNATGPAGTFTRTGSDPSVIVAQAAASVVCNANTPCISPTLSAGSSSTAIPTDAQVTAQTGPQADQLNVILPDPTAAPMLCQQTGGNFGSIVTWAVTARTSTLVYTVHAPNAMYTYDLGDTCFGSTLPFPGAVQNPANGNEFEGTLPFCMATEPNVTNPPPCVESIVPHPQGGPADPETVTVTVDAPQGDPKFSG